MKKFLMVVVSIAFGAILAGNAMAATIPNVGDLAVDFRTSAWYPANGQSSFSPDGIVTATAASPQGAFLFQDNVEKVDGLGILGGENDEIDSYKDIYGNIRNETLQVYIDGGMCLSGVWLTDIFLSYNLLNSPKENYTGSNPAGEPGRVVLNGDIAHPIDFFGKQGNDGISNGELYVDFGGSILVTSALFSVLQGDGSYANIEYSVAGFEGCPVPEPATMLLLGFGLAGLAGVRRRMQS
ncbi:MAG: PEP-CTERM sorting domain-containing protein [Nitrospirota bacterium]